MGLKPKRFPVRFGKWSIFYTLLGMPPSRSWVEVDEHDVHVQMGWAFRTAFPRSSITSIEHDTARVWGWGVHGWNGSWLVNATSSGIVRIAIEPQTCAHVLIASVKLRVLRVGVEDPDGLIKLLSTPPTA
jgi:hypothetical protein